MKYISFDAFDEADLSKQREACFIGGTNGDTLPTNITSAREEHSANVRSLKHTMTLFERDEPKKRLHGKVAERYEQERKWVKHFDACIAEHKKGLQVSKLKTELKETKDKAAKILSAVNASYAVKLEELRKQCRVQYRAEWDAEAKAKAEKEKKEAKVEKKKHTFFGWINNLFAGKPKKKTEAKPVPAAALVAKQVVKDGDEAAKKKREFYQLLAEKNKQAAKKAA